MRCKNIETQKTGVFQPPMPWGETRLLDCGFAYAARGAASKEKTGETIK